MIKLLWEVARRSFRQASTYRLATASGAFVNTVFGYVRASVLIFVATQNGGEIRGLSGEDLVTFAFMSQAFIMTVGAFSRSKLPARILSGDIEVDLYRPIDLQLWELANWVGNSAFQIVARGLPPILLGAIAYDLAWPDSASQWLLFAVSTVLASLAGFGLRFCTNLTAFWLLDIRGVESMATAVIMFFAGLLLPINLFPPWLEAVARALPFASMIQLPTEVFLGLYSSSEVAWILIQQLLWALALVGFGRLILGSATRRLEVQGG